MSTIHKCYLQDSVFMTSISTLLFLHSLLTLISLINFFTNYFTYKDIIIIYPSSNLENIIIGKLHEDLLSNIQYIN